MCPRVTFEFKFKAFNNVMSTMLYPPLQNQTLFLEALNSKGSINFTIVDHNSGYPSMCNHQNIHILF